MKLTSSPPPPSTVRSNTSYSSSDSPIPYTVMFPTFFNVSGFPRPCSLSTQSQRSSAPLRQNKYNPKPHTTPDKHGASAKVNPTSDNKKDPQVRQCKKNGKNKPSSDYSDSSITAAILWQLLIENPVLFLV